MANGSFNWIADPFSSWLPIIKVGAPLASRRKNDASAQLKSKVEYIQSQKFTYISIEVERSELDSSFDCIDGRIHLRRLRLHRFVHWPQQLSIQFYHNPLRLSGRI